MEQNLNKQLHIQPIKQPESECAPACLVAVLKYYGIQVKIDEVVKSVPPHSPKWRDWLYWMGIVALKKGLKADVVTMSTQTFDMSWRTLSSKKLLNKLSKEFAFVKQIQKTKKRSSAYFLEHHPVVEAIEIEAAIEFLELGGRISIEPTTGNLLIGTINGGVPVIASLDASILYRTKRGIPNDDDIKGTTWGHVVIIDGFTDKTFSIADPADWYRKNQRFAVPHEYLIESILRRDQNVLLVKK